MASIRILSRALSGARASGFVIGMSACRQDRVELDIEDLQSHGEVYSIELAELKSTLSKSAIGKSCDEHDVVVELLQSTNDDFLILLLGQCNDILTRRVIDEELLSVAFKMLPKHDDLQNPSIWRPQQYYLLFIKSLLRSLLIESINYWTASKAMIHVASGQASESNTFFCIPDDLIGKAN